MEWELSFDLYPENPSDEGYPDLIVRMPPVRPNKGRFIDGVWHCNCDPRLPASHFQVKKDSGNKGRWFYTCTKPQKEQCGFFLWDKDAEEREKDTLLSNSRTEVDIMPPPRTPGREKPGTCLLTPMSEQIQRAAEKYGTPQSNRVDREPRSLEEAHTRGFSPSNEYDENGMETPSRKRKHDASSEVDINKAQRLNSPPPSHRQPVTTRLTGTEAADGFGASSSTARRLDFGTAKKALTGPAVTQPQSAEDPIERKVLLGPANPGLYQPHTPHKVLLGPAPVTPSSATPSHSSSSPNKDGNYPITTTILAALSSYNSTIPPTARQAVKDTLNSYALRVSGVEKGRDITRLALKKKDEKIAELERRIQELKAERELDKTVIKHFKNDMAESVAAKMGNGGRGKG